MDSKKEDNTALVDDNDPLTNFRYVPKRKLSEAEKQIILLRIEKVKLQREKAILILNKSIMLFFAILAVSVVGLLNKMVSPFQLNLLMLISVLTLIVGVMPYSFSSKKEEKELENTIEELTN
jgi:hypothetical protein